MMRIAMFIAILGLSACNRDYRVMNNAEIDECHQKGGKIYFAYQKGISEGSDACLISLESDPK